MKTFKRPCKKCGRAVIQSPMNPKVRLCDGCDMSPINCNCEPLKPAYDWHGAEESLERLRFIDSLETTAPCPDGCTGFLPLDSCAKCHGSGVITVPFVPVAGSNCVKCGSPLDYDGYCFRACDRIACPRAKSDMTPCMVRYRSFATADDGHCVGCGIAGPGVLSANLIDALKQGGTGSLAGPDDVQSRFPESVRLTSEGAARLDNILHDANQLLISLPQEGYVLGDWHKDLSLRISEEIRFFDALKEAARITRFGDKPE